MNPTNAGRLTSACLVPLKRAKSMRNPPSFPLPATRPCHPHLSLFPHLPHRFYSSSPPLPHRLRVGGLDGWPGGWGESGVEWEYIFSLSVFARRESSNARTHTTSSGRRPNLKPVLRGSARYFIGRDQRTPSSRRSYVRMCSSRRDKGRQKTKRLNRIQRLYCILLLFLDIEVLFINLTLSL